ncbi:phosphoglycerate mutase family protein-like protein [Lophiostoma macrostomum CBS 122681]|uniref:Phosphoglycerate mutase family protein-like protein n=1 Tax=Lophiostoma macrostomum CBS 122681 TaxID=1314788 RepID=A0A6A6SV45_9PLEO|nr:phosphoglycerate mutase family protein-like protein [Lophiostoma macrostomum CBS 122681]
MPPKLYLVRHAQGEHNATQDYTLPDPVLTEKGEDQCRKLQDSFLYHETIELVLASPLRRTIQTAALSFGPTLARNDVTFIAVPEAQEVSDMGSDTGSAPNELKGYLAKLFADGTLDFDIKQKLDLSLVKEGWNVKSGYYAYTREAISKRAADLRSWLFQRPEDHVLLVTHGAFLHFLTEDWDVDDPMIGTSYHNCELRQFVFTPGSSKDDAHVTETAESLNSRGAHEEEKDPHVVDELKTLSNGHA